MNEQADFWLGHPAFEQEELVLWPVPATKIPAPLPGNGARMHPPVGTGDGAGTGDNIDPREG